MDLNVKNVNNLPEPKPINISDNKLPTIIGEHRMFVAIPNDDATKLIYKTLYDSLSTYLIKIPSSPAKLAVKKLLDRNLIYIGRSLSASGKNGIIGRHICTSDYRLAGTVIDIVELDIDPSTGETIHIDQVFYAAYYQFIKAAVFINFKKIKDDKKLHSYLIKYLNYIIIRIIGSNTSLTNKQKINLEILSAYFCYRFYLNFNHIQSRNNSIESISDKSLVDNSINILIDRLEKYEFMKDIFKALIDFGIISESPASLIMKSLMFFKLTGFYSITTTIDYFIATCILSIYPVSFLQNTLVSKDLQSKIEDIITPLINSVKFDTVILSKL
jgi:hypothetical protein